tara:strand:- start:2059 stop:2481 length:423 start_codon:yes stop_codon:yes gene_type:complete
MINQLFSIQPDKKNIMKCINILGFEKLDDKKELSKIDILSMNICVEFQKLNIYFRTIYLPCKHSNFLTNYHFKNCITITRQLLRTINYDILSKEKMIKNTKMMVYRIISKSEKEQYKISKRRKKGGNIKKLNEPIVIDFN